MYKTIVMDLMKITAIFQTLTLEHLIYFLIAIMSFCYSIVPETSVFYKRALHLPCICPDARFLCVKKGKIGKTQNI